MLFFLPPCIMMKSSVVAQYSHLLGYIQLPFFFFFQSFTKICYFTLYYLLNLVFFFSYNCSSLSHSHCHLLELSINIIFTGNRVEKNQQLLRTFCKLGIIQTYFKHYLTFTTNCESYYSHFTYGETEVPRCSVSVGVCRSLSCV